MKIYLDTANVKEIHEAASLGLLDGVTTNPSLVVKEGRSFREMLQEVCKIVDGPISAEVVSVEADAMVKEGKELGTIKLLKIGTNRVLIEEKGEKKELTIFSGFGGESLMPKEEKKGQDTKKDAKLEPKKTEEKDTKPNDPTKKSA